MHHRSRCAILLACVFGFTLCYGQSDPTIKTTDGKGSRRTKEVDHFLQSQVDTLGITGLSIALLEDGKVVYHRTMGMKDKEKGEKADSNTLFEAASMTKPVFAYVVLKLVRKGVLSLDTPLYRYYP